MNLPFWIILAVCAVVLCVGLSLARMVNFGAGVAEKQKAKTPSIREDSAQTNGLMSRGPDSYGWPTRTIPNEQAKRRAIMAKIVRKM